MLMSSRKSEYTVAAVVEHCARVVVDSARRMAGFKCDPDGKILPVDIKATRL
jgi:hypothetical protein